MENIKISVIGKYAQSPTVEIVCDNSDYRIEFDFSEEWLEHELKTARFVYGGREHEEPFRGNVVQVPPITDATLLEVGVYAGNLSTTTPALISCRKSILGKRGLPPDPQPDVYSRIIDMISNGMLQGPPGERGETGEAGKDGVDGKDGRTPILGVDYWTDTEQAEIKEYIDNQVGEINTLLDAIIAKQTRIIGGGS